MLWKMAKIGVMTTGGALLAGGLVFGTDLGSYVRSSYHEVRASVKDNIPIEFELRRARDLLDGVGPELHQNIRLVAEQEVEIANLKTDLKDGQANLAAEKQRIEKLRNCLATEQTSFEFGGLEITRTQLTQDLSRQFTHFKEAETAMVAKQDLLTNRERSLTAAMDAMETAKAQKATLEAQIEGLEAQYRLVQSASKGTDVQMDHSKLAQAQKVVGDIRKQLAVAEHVLAHEAKFTQDVPIDTVNEKDLLTQVDEHFGNSVAMDKHRDAEAQTGN
jgi:predicted  nucleic acid-binding Zn-ribbon protein